MMREKVLIIVMTYPHPSEKYEELVCTAGITESLEWVRLYPVDYRYRDRKQRFKKYQWIDVELQAPKSNDNRKESRRPVLDSIRLLGERLNTKNNWAERRALIDQMPHHTVRELKELYDKERVSLGIVRPSRVLDLEVRRADPDWKPEWQNIYDQLRLFEPPPKPLRKLPYSFHYVFECERGGKPHTAMCEDWELGTLFLKESDRLGSEEAAAESVKNKFFGELCRHDKDTRFFMGTRFPYNVWLVLGVFWPPIIQRVEIKKEQPTLF